MVIDLSKTDIDALADLCTSLRYLGNIQLKLGMLLDGEESRRSLHQSRPNFLTVGLGCSSLRFPQVFAPNFQSERWQHTEPEKAQHVFGVFYRPYNPQKTRLKQAL